jgi:hypothetical protein
MFYSRKQWNCENVVRWLARRVGKTAPKIAAEINNTGDRNYRLRLRAAFTLQMRFLGFNQVDQN